MLDGCEPSQLRLLSSTSPPKWGTMLNHPVGLLCSAGTEVNPQVGLLCSPGTKVNPQVGLLFS